MARRAAERERARLEAEQDTPDGHEGHHTHLRGSAVSCSCGADFGVTCVVLPDFSSRAEAEAWWSSLACSVCGEPGVTS